MPDDTIPELGAANPVETSVALSATYPDNGVLRVSVYRRYVYAVDAGSSGGTSIHKHGPEFATTITLLPSGDQYSGSFDVTATATDILNDFRSWIDEQLQSNTLSTEKARQYVAAYLFSSGTSFTHQVAALLLAAPTDESSEQVDRLRSEAVAALGYVLG